MELFLKTFTNNNADTYKSYIRRTCTPKPWPPFGHLFEELFCIGARIRYVKNINAYNNKQLLISRGAWGVPVPGTEEILQVVQNERKSKIFFLLYPKFGHLLATFSRKGMEKGCRLTPLKHCFNPHSKQPIHSGTRHAVGIFIQ